MKRPLLALGLMAALAGCTQKVATPPEAATPPAADTAPAAATAQPASDAAQGPATPEPAADASATVTAQPLAGHWQEGKNYQLILPPQPTSADPGQVEIIEFLWLGCPHCYELNPYVEAWKKKLPPYVKFVQEHVMWEGRTAPDARLFYTLEALGRDDLVPKVFDEVQVRRKGADLVGNSEAETQQLQLAFAVANGISAEDFKGTSSGFAVSTRLQHANELTRAYRVELVPNFFVNGKYRTDVEMAGGPKELIQLLTDLAASEKKH